MSRKNHLSGHGVEVNRLRDVHGVPLCQVSLTQRFHFLAVPIGGCLP